MESLSIAVTGRQGALDRQYKWRAGLPGQTCDINMKPQDNLRLTVGSKHKCDIRCSGDIELSATASGPDGHQVFTWSEAARKAGKGDGTIEVVSGKDRDDPCTLSITLDKDESTIEDLDDDSESINAKEGNIFTRRPDTGIPLLDQYGAYVIGLLGAAGALFFGWLHPEWQGWLFAGAGSIATFTFFCSEEYDAFIARALLFLGAGVCMVAVLYMSDYWKELTWAAGALSTAAILYGNGESAF